MNVTHDTYPNVHAALLTLSIDQGDHLIGRVYPGKAIDLERFAIPPKWRDLVAPAEAGLARLAADNPDTSHLLEPYDSAFEAFVQGEQTDGETIQRERGDLDAAQTLLNAWFDGWTE